MEEIGSYNSSSMGESSVSSFSFANCTCGGVSTGNSVLWGAGAIDKEMPG